MLRLKNEYKLREIVAIAAELGDLAYTIPPSLLEASLTRRLIPAFVIDLLGGEDQVPVAKSYEEENIEAEIASLDAEYEQVVKSGFGPQTRSILEGISAEIASRKSQLEGLRNIPARVEQYVLGRLGQPVFDYRHDTLLWAQQRSATQVWLKDNFGVEGIDELILMPIGEQPEKPFKKEDAGKIAILYANPDPDSASLHLVAVLTPTGSNSAFFKQVSYLLGKTKVSDGVNHVTPFDPAGYQITQLKRKVIRP